MPNEFQLNEAYFVQTTSFSTLRIGPGLSEPPSATGSGPGPSILAPHAPERLEGDHLTRLDHDLPFPHEQLAK